jgi:2-polyprenyl-3-methyl-5-hydroxy-6-metoxy-1,4-benzoquinol methylase
MMKNSLKIWHWECAKCGYEKSDFEPAINTKIVHEKIDEQQREKGLRALRIENYGTLLDAIEKIRTASGRLLDVGCAHGWFLEAAKERGFDTLGIEPDQQFIATAPHGITIRQGFFPDILEETAQFDVIVFNDVLEHMPDVKAVLSGCRKHLKPGGVLVISPQGKHLGTLATGVPTANCGWGDDGGTLYITANNMLLRLKTTTRGAGW